MNTGEDLFSHFVRQLSDHCEHCAGKPGRCVCTSCPRKPESKCVPPSETIETLETLLKALEIAANGSASSTDHCAHCRGLEAKCGCEHGCPAPSHVKCIPVHKNVRCGQCGDTPLCGSRLQCTECDDFDLCGTCYKKEEDIHLHHSFRHIQRPGDKNREVLEPRKKTLHCVHCPGNAGECNCKKGCSVPEGAKCVEVHNIPCSGKGCQKQRITGTLYECTECTSMSQYLCSSCYDNGKGHVMHSYARIERGGKGKVKLDPREKEGNREMTFYEDMTSASLMEYLDKHGVSYEGVTERQELKRFVWDCHVNSIPDNQVSLYSEKLGINLTDCTSDGERRYRLRRAGFNTGFRMGNQVVLKNLEAGHMNGMKGVVDSTPPNPEARVVVRLNANGAKVSIKRENLEPSQ